VAADLNMIVDVVDNKNHVVGKAERQALLRARLNFRTVHVLLFDYLGRLVLQRLPPDHLRNPCRLGSSVAGYLRSMEGYEDAAKRKLWEELRVTSRLKNIGQFKMIDEGSRKFVGVFIGKLQQHPKFEHDESFELIYLERRDLITQIRKNPENFTPTFLLVYEHFRRWERKSS